MWELLFGTGEFLQGVAWIPIMMAIQAAMQGGGMIMDARERAHLDRKAKSKATRETREAIGASKARSTQGGTAGAVGAPAGAAPAGLVENLANIQSAPSPQVPWLDLANLIMGTTGSMYSAVQAGQQQSAIDEMLKNLGYGNQGLTAAMLQQFLKPASAARTGEKDWLNLKTGSDQKTNRGLGGNPDWTFTGGP